MFYVRLIVCLSVLISFDQVISILFQHPETSSPEQIELILSVLAVLSKQKVSMCFWMENNNLEAEIAKNVVNNHTEIDNIRIDQVTFNLFLSNIRSIEDQVVDGLELLMDTDIPKFGCLRKLDVHDVMEEQIRKLKTRLTMQISHEMLIKQLCTAEKRFERALNEIDWNSDVLNSAKVKTLILFVNASKNNDNPTRLLTDHLRPVTTSSFNYAVTLTNSKRNEYIQSIMTCLWNYRNSQWALDEFINPVSVIGEFMIDLTNTDRSLNTLSDDCTRIQNLIRRYEPSASDYELNTICDFAHRFEKNFFRGFTANEIGLDSSHELIDDVVILDSQTCRFSMKNIRERSSFYFNKYFVSNTIPLGFNRNSLELLLSVENRFITYLNEFNLPKNIEFYIKMARQRFFNFFPNTESDQIIPHVDLDIEFVSKLELMQTRCIEERYKSIIRTPFENS